MFTLVKVEMAAWLKIRAKRCNFELGEFAVSF